MKKVGVIFCLSILLVMMTSSFGFAEGNFAIESSYPENGKGGFQPVNMAVKLYFTEDVTSGAAQEANKNAFTLTSASGDTVSYTAVYDAKKDPRYILIHINDTLESDMEYTLTVSENLVSSDGEQLGVPASVSFKTRNTGTDASVNMGLMFVMVIGMIGFMTWDTRRQAKKEQKEAGVTEKFNPYKVAKETGKSVEEVIAEHEKKLAREAKRKARMEKGGSADDEDEVPEGVFRVKAKRPISAVGGKTPKSVIDKRIAKEKAAEEAARRKAEARSGKSNKAKGSKQQQKKKKK